jgi:hypothetical protein
MSWVMRLLSGVGHETDAALGKQPAHHLLGVVLEHLDHGALAPAPAVHAHHPRHRPVTVQQTLHLPGREEQIVAALVRHQETETVRMADDAPAHQVLLVDRHVGTAAVAHQLAVALHGAQAPGERLDVHGIGQAEPLGKRVKGHRAIRFVDDLENHFPAGDGPLVPPGLAFKLWVFGGILLFSCHLTRGCRGKVSMPLREH